ncbi:DUF2807 domain-containing protein [Flavobacteriaceae bacterium 3-367]
MKNSILTLTVLLLAAHFSFAQSRQILQLDSFENVDLDGNIRLFLEQGTTPVVELEAKKERHLAEYYVEVRNGTLFIQHREEEGFRSAPKIHVYLSHPGISGLEMDGLIHVVSTAPVESETLRIKGDGLIKGDLEVNVKTLKIGLDGLCTMYLSGHADEADLQLNGMGKIDARELETAELRKSADGLARVRVGGR